MLVGRQPVRMPLAARLFACGAWSTRVLAALLFALGVGVRAHVRATLPDSPMPIQPSAPAPLAHDPVNSSTVKIEELPDDDWVVVKQF